MSSKSLHCALCGALDSPIRCQSPVTQSRAKQSEHGFQCEIDGAHRLPEPFPVRTLEEVSVVIKWLGKSLQRSAARSTRCTYEGLSGSASATADLPRLRSLGGDHNETREQARRIFGQLLFQVVPSLS